MATGDEKVEQLMREQKFSGYLLLLVLSPVHTLSWRRKWQPLPVFLPGEFHGQRSLAGYSPGAHKQLDTTELLNHTTTPVT